VGRKRSYGPTVIVLVAALVAAAALVFLVTAGPATDYCERAALLREARQPEEALAAYSRAEAGGETCKDRGWRIRIETALPQADADFASAAARAEAAEGDAAVELYIAGLENDPASVGALAALGKLLSESAEGDEKGVRPAKQGCEWSTRLTAAGLPGAAEIALASDSDLKRAACVEADKSLADANRLAESRLIAGKNHEQEGNDAEARSTYAAALHADAGLGAAQTGLERTLGTETPANEVTSWLGDVPGSLQDALKWAIPVIVGVLLLALLLWIGVRQLAGAWLGLRQHLEAAGKSPGLSLLRRVAQPELHVEVFEGGDPEGTGRSFSTLLSQALSERAGKESEFVFDRVASGSEADQGAAKEIGELATEIPQTKLLGSVLTEFAKLFRRRKVTIRGYLIPAAGNRGVGVALTLEGSGMRSEARKTIWEEEFDPQPGSGKAERWLRLVPAATIWARRRLQREMRPDLKLSAEGWRADALLQAGVWWQARGDLGRAEALFADALERDPGLLPALHNLTVVEVHRAQYSQALARLDRLSRELRDPQARERWPTLETGYLYTRALALSYEARKDGSVDSAKLSLALETASTLVRELPAKAAKTPGAEELERAHAPAPGDEDLVELTNAEGPAVALLAALTVQGDRTAAIRALNCPDQSPLSREDLNKRPSLGPCALVDRYLLTRQSLSRRTRFNLACYYTVLAEATRGEDRDNCLDDALDQLDLALEGGELIAWASGDPALAFLKEERKDEFNEALERHTVGTHSASDDGTA
jgi:tetratricopeptide (TPR) repeat protein